MVSLLRGSLLVCLWASALGFSIIPLRSEPEKTSVYTETIYDTPIPLFMKLSILSWKNNTGHWVSKVNLQHSEYGGKEGDPWRVEVQQSSTEALDGKGIVVIDTTLTSPEGPRKLYTSEDRVFPGVGEYMFYYTPSSWHEAKAVCEHHKSTLAVVHSQQEADAIKELFEVWKVSGDDYKNNTAHIGFNDLEEEGHYLTLEGKTLQESGYAIWEPGNPNINLHEDCGAIDRKGLLHDVKCSVLLPFICQVQ